MNNRPTHRVSVKIALLNSAKDQVLMTVLPTGGHGLPGGHVEGIERPEQALTRELQEELGLDQYMYHDVEQRQFWREQGGDRIILGYTGVLDDDAVIMVDANEVLGTIWVSREDILSGSISSEAYNEYIVRVLASNDVSARRDKE